MPIVREPGKFEGELQLCEILYSMTLDGGADEEAGDVESTGWYGLMIDVKLSDLIDAGKDMRISEKDIREDFDAVRAGKNYAVRRDERVHAILHANDQGFVECEFYPDIREAREEFERISHEIAVEEGEEEPNEPQEGDWFTEDHRRFYEVGGSGSDVFSRRLGRGAICEVPRDASEGAMWRILERCMKKANYYPNVWFISDHGNAHLMTKPAKGSTRGINEDGPYWSKSGQMLGLGKRKRSRGARQGNRCRSRQGQFARCR
jgi:hypothetical protein